MHVILLSAYYNVVSLLLLCTCYWRNSKSAHETARKMENGKRHVRSRKGQKKEGRRKTNSAKKER